METRNWAVTEFPLAQLSAYTFQTEYIHQKKNKNIKINIRQRYKYARKFVFIVIIRLFGALEHRDKELGCYRVSSGPVECLYISNRVHPPKEIKKIKINIQQRYKYAKKFVFIVIIRLFGALEHRNKELIY